MAWMGMDVTPGIMPGMANRNEMAALGDRDGPSAAHLFYALMSYTTSAAIAHERPRPSPR